jgi:hypothetical protein
LTPPLARRERRQQKAKTMARQTKQRGTVTQIEQTGAFSQFVTVRFDDGSIGEKGQDTNEALRVGSRVEVETWIVRHGTKHTSTGHAYNTDTRSRFVPIYPEETAAITR